MRNRYKADTVRESKDSEAPAVTGEPGRRENPVAEGGEVGQRLALGGKIEWGERWSRALVGDDDFLQRVM